MLGDHRSSCRRRMQLMVHTHRTAVVNSKILMGTSYQDARYTVVSQWFLQPTVCCYVSRLLINEVRQTNVQKLIALWFFVRSNRCLQFELPNDIFQIKSTYVKNKNLITKMSVIFLVIGYLLSRFSFAIFYSNAFSRLEHKIYITYELEICFSTQLKFQEKDGEKLEKREKKKIWNSLVFSESV